MKANSIATWSLSAILLATACGSEDDAGSSATPTPSAGANEPAAPGLAGTGGGAEAPSATGGTNTDPTALPAQPGESGPDLALGEPEPVTPGDTQLDNASTCSSLSLTPEEVQTEEEVTTTIETEVPKPVALYVMLDNTLSMDQSAGVGGESRWDAAVSALTDFVADPASAGMNIALQYFFPVGVPGDVDVCVGDGQAIPAVDMGVLPEAGPAIVQSLAETGKEPQTPTVGALTGAVDYCVAYEAEHPEEDCVVVFVTDGLPHGCGLSSQCQGAATGGFGRPMNDLNCVDPGAEAALTPIAAAGLEAGVVSFMIGMNGVPEEGFALLDAMAVAGGSDCTPDGGAGDEACDVSTSGAEGLVKALAAIRESITVTETQVETVVTTEVTTVPCQWTIPASPSGETLDPELVNVDIVDTVTEAETPMVYATVDACAAATGPAWYYDIPDAPTTILVCPQTCDQISAQPTAKVDVKFGCERNDLVY